MAENTFDVITFAERPIPRPVEGAIIAAGWKAFMLEDTVANRYFMRLYRDFPQHQFGLYDAAGELAAVCNSIPFRWDGSLESLSPRGWDWVMETGMAEREGGIQPNAMSAISITIAPAYKSQGVSRAAVRAMKQIARANGLTALFAPVRPSLKAAYPLTPMERYVEWKHTDGEAPFDPWLRTHWRAGAKIIRVCPESMVVPGTVAQWEEWTGMRFPESGPYIVPGALNPVEFDLERDLGRYVEPNVWMQHDLSQ
jgi:GNAT superfamily N-acetyltransferase